MKFLTRYASRLLLTLVLAAGVPAALDAQGGGTPASGEGMGGSEVMTSASYRIATLDVIRVTLYVADEVQFKTEARVSQNGTISLPYLGSIEVVGLTMDEVRKRLYEPYNRDYYVEPHLDVAILAYSERFVTVIGKVNSQGPVPFPTEEQMYLLEAIARAGGWSNDRLADMRNVTITRTNDEGERQTIQVDARNITARDHPLKDGDLVNVPERMW